MHLAKTVSIAAITAGTVGTAGPFENGGTFKSDQNLYDFQRRRKTMSRNLMDYYDDNDDDDDDDDDDYDDDDDDDNDDSDDDE
ncbi:hypothetical protein HZH66_011269 [Vespula vulgaris]|uniref:Uncharacterized protein n=1 Tax=Vespula vulgaris TaxID=7454 RepID=A0A834JGP2_VESVU|nr:hypothetical protein HZH66_011269 [Vespula vulgaris]